MGALRDVGQNHLLQMLALVTMDNPRSLKTEEIREKKLEILKSLPKMTSTEIRKNTLRAQYRGYLEIPGVKSNSQTETYFKIKTYLSNPRWKGVPIYLESGKRMEEDLVEITITFREKKPYPFYLPEQEYKNTLCFKIRPKEGIIYNFFVKKPGKEMEIEKKELHFFYEESYNEEERLPEYQRLLIDTFTGDQLLFLSTKEILASWEFINPILKSWQKGIPPLRFYKSQADLKKYDQI